MLYGGAAGGGKTDWLLMEAFLYVDVPGYSALILRETFPALSHEPDGLIPRSHGWLSGTPARWAAQTKTWHFPSGATVTFGYLQGPRGHYRYAGPSYQLIAFDEVTEMRPESYLYLQSRLRRLKGSSVPLRVRAASNPGGRSHAWFRDRFNLADGGPTPTMRRDLGRVYIPARVTDNPHLDVDAYLETLSHLAPTDRARLLEGDWSAHDGGAMFQPYWFDVVRDYRREGARLVRAWDLAATAPTGPGHDPDWTVGLLMARTVDDRYVIVDVVRDRTTPGGVERMVRATADRDGPDVPVLIEEEGGSSGKAVIAHYRRHVVPDRRMLSVRPTGSKVTRATPFAIAAEAGNVAIVSAPWNEPLLTEVTMFPDDGGHDDQVDAAAMAYNWLARHGGWSAA